MTDEELNTKLYRKMSAEQAAYREHLLTLPPGEILDHAYEYSTRADILEAMKNDDLSPKQASALLQCEKPLDTVFWHYEDHGRGRMKDLWNAIEGKANAAMRECIKRSPQQKR